MSEWMISGPTAGRPALLENRIFLLPIAVEILAILETNESAGIDRWNAIVDDHRSRVTSLH
jgi:hypothetical protein